MSATAPTPSTAPAAASAIFRTAAVTSLIGGLAALVLAAIAMGLGVSMEVEMAGSVQQTPLPAFLVAAFFQSIAGALVALGIQRFSNRPRRTWLITAGVVVALTFGQPLALAQDTATTLTLVLAHLVVAAVVVPAIAKLLPEVRTSDT